MVNNKKKNKIENSNLRNVDGLRVSVLKFKSRSYIPT